MKLQFEKTVLKDTLQLQHTGSKVRDFASFWFDVVLYIQLINQLNKLKTLGKVELPDARVCIIGSNMKHLTLKKRIEIMGFESYEEYLDSPLWHNIRGKIKKRFKNKCQACGSKKKLNVHHTKYGYKILYGDSFKGLYLLCQNCHKEVHLLKGNNLLFNTRKIIKQKKQQKFG